MAIKRVAHTQAVIDLTMEGADKVIQQLEQVGKIKKQTDDEFNQVKTYKIEVDEAGAVKLKELQNSLGVDGIKLLKLAIDEDFFADKMKKAVKNGNVKAQNEIEQLELMFKNIFMDSDDYAFELNKRYKEATVELEKQENLLLEQEKIIKRLESIQTDSKKKKSDKGNPKEEMLLAYDQYLEMLDSDDDDVDEDSISINFLNAVKKYINNLKSGTNIKKDLGKNEEFLEDFLFTIDDVYRRYVSGSKNINEVDDLFALSDKQAKELKEMERASNKESKDSSQKDTNSLQAVLDAHKKTQEDLANSQARIAMLEEEIAKFEAIKNQEITQQSKKEIKRSNSSNDKEDEPKRKALEELLQQLSASSAVPIVIDPANLDEFFNKIESRRAKINIDVANVEELVKILNQNYYSDLYDKFLYQFKGLNETGTRKAKGVKALTPNELGIKAREILQNAQSRELTDDDYAQLLALGNAFREQQIAAKKVQSKAKMDVSKIDTNTQIFENIAAEYGVDIEEYRSKIENFAKKIGAVFTQSKKAVKVKDIQPKLSSKNIVDDLQNINNENKPPQIDVDANVELLIDPNEISSLKGIIEEGINPIKVELESDGENISKKEKDSIIKSNNDIKQDEVNNDSKSIVKNQKINIWDGIDSNTKTLIKYIDKQKGVYEKNKNILAKISTLIKGSVDKQKPLDKKQIADLVAMMEVYQESAETYLSISDVLKHAGVKDFDKVIPGYGKLKDAYEEVAQKAADNNIEINIKPKKKSAENIKKGIQKDLEKKSLEIKTDKKEDKLEELKEPQKPIAITPSNLKEFYSKIEAYGKNNPAKISIKANIDPNSVKEIQESINNTNNQESIINDNISQNNNEQDFSRIVQLYQEIYALKNEIQSSSENLINSEDLKKNGTVTKKSIMGIVKEWENILKQDIPQNAKDEEIKPLKNKLAAYVSAYSDFDKIRIELGSKHPKVWAAISDQVLNVTNSLTDLNAIQQKTAELFVEIEKVTGKALTSEQKMSIANSKSFTDLNKIIEVNNNNQQEDKAPKKSNNPLDEHPVHIKLVPSVDELKQDINSISDPNNPHLIYIKLKDDIGKQLDAEEITSLVGNIKNITDAFNSVSQNVDNNTQRQITSINKVSLAVSHLKELLKSIGVYTKDDLNDVMKAAAQAMVDAEKLKQEQAKTKEAEAKAQAAQQKNIDAEVNKIKKAAEEKAKVEEKAVKESEKKVKEEAKKGNNNSNLVEDLEQIEKFKSEGLISSYKIDNKGYIIISNLLSEIGDQAFYATYKISELKEVLTDGNLDFTKLNKFKESKVETKKIKSQRATGSGGLGGSNNSEDDERISTDLAVAYREKLIAEIKAAKKNGMLPEGFALNESSIQVGTKGALQFNAAVKELGKETVNAAYYFKDFYEILNENDNIDLQHLEKGWIGNFTKNAKLSDDKVENIFNKFNDLKNNFDKDGLLNQLVIGDDNKQTVLSAYISNIENQIISLHNNLNSLEYASDNQRKSDIKRYESLIAEYKQIVNTEQFKTNSSKGKYPSTYKGQISGRLDSNYKKSIHQNLRNFYKNDDNGYDEIRITDQLTMLSDGTAQVKAVASKDGALQNITIKLRQIIDESGRAKIAINEVIGSGEIDRTNLNKSMRNYLKSVEETLNNYDSKSILDQVLNIDGKDVNLKKKLSNLKYSIKKTMDSITEGTFKEDPLKIEESLRKRVALFKQLSSTVYQKDNNSKKHVSKYVGSIGGSFDNQNIDKLIKERYESLGYSNVEIVKSLDKLSNNKAETTLRLFKDGQYQEVVLSLRQIKNAAGEAEIAINEMAKAGSVDNQKLAEGLQNKIRGIKKLLSGYDENNILDQLVTVFKDGSNETVKLSTYLDEVVYKIYEIIEAIESGNYKGDLKDKKVELASYVELYKQLNAQKNQKHNNNKGNNVSVYKDSVFGSLEDNDDVIKKKIKDLYLQEQYEEAKVKSLKRLKDNQAKLEMELVKNGKLEKKTIGLREITNTKGSQMLAINEISGNGAIDKPVNKQVENIYNNYLKLKNSFDKENILERMIIGDDNQQVKVSNYIDELEDKIWILYDDLKKLDYGSENKRQEDIALLKNLIDEYKSITKDKSNQKDINSGRYFSEYKTNLNGSLDRNDKNTLKAAQNEIENYYKSLQNGFDQVVIKEPLNMLADGTAEASLTLYDTVNGKYQDILVSLRQIVNESGNVVLALNEITKAGEGDSTKLDKSTNNLLSKSLKELNKFDNNNLLDIAVPINENGEIVYRKLIDYVKELRLEINKLITSIKNGEVGADLDAKKAELESLVDKLSSYNIDKYKKNYNKGKYKSQYLGDDQLFTLREDETIDSFNAEEIRNKIIPIIKLQKGEVIDLDDKVLKLKDGIVEIGYVIKNGRNFEEGTLQLREFNRTADETVVSINKAVKKIGIEQSIWGKFIAEFKRKFKNMFQYISGAEIINRTMMQIRQGFQFVKELDTAMTTIYETMDITREGLDILSSSSIKAAKALGATADQMIDSVNIYAAYGKTVDQMLSQATPTVMLANAMQGSAEDASTYIQSVNL